MGYQGTSSAEKITSHSLIGLNSRENSISLTNLLRANDIWGWIGWTLSISGVNGPRWTLSISGVNGPHMTDAYCNRIELTRREFSYLMDLIPALNKDGLPEELSPCKTRA